MEHLLTIDVVPSVIVTLLRLGFVYVMTRAHAQQSFGEYRTTPNPPTIAPINKLVRPSLEPTQLDCISLHINDPT